MSVYIIAEAGVNHNGSLEMAKELISVAAQAGADAVKFQTFKTDKVISQYAPKAEYQKNVTKQNESQYEMVKKLELNEEDHIELIRYSKEKGIDFLSSPFDFESVDLLTKKFQVSALKIASGEVTNAPLLLYAAQTGKPIILSTGMCSLQDIERALGVLAFGYLQVNETPSIDSFHNAFCSIQGQEILRNKVTLLHCTTEYPAPIDEINLNALDTLSRSFGLKVGYSDHTLGITIPIAAVAKGAHIIEKHFTLDKTLPGPDHKASLDPIELKNMVNSIRQVERAMGSGIKIPSESEKKNIAIARRSIIASRDIKKGESFSPDNITTKRPGGGLSPFSYWELLGKSAIRDFKKDELISY